MKTRIKLIINASIVLVSLLSCTNKGTVNNKPISPIFYESHEPKKQDAPFSDAVQVGNMYFLAGQIGIIPFLI